MSFTISSGSESRLETAIAVYASSAKGCSLGGCTVGANWQAFKKDPTYDHYMRAHRVKVGKMQAVSPPGFGGTVKHMAEDHKDISNPHALAWYMYEKGDKSHKKAPKGSGAKHISKEVSKKRSKALEAGGPGSGRTPYGGAKPAWQKDSPDKHMLDNFHKEAVKGGYKYKSSSGPTRGVVEHTYKNSTSDVAKIAESKNGNHSFYFPSRALHYSPMKALEAGGPGSGRHKEDKFREGQRVHIRPGYYSNGDWSPKEPSTGRVVEKASNSGIWTVNHGGKNKYFDESDISDKPFKSMKSSVDTQRKLRTKMQQEYEHGMKAGPLTPTTTTKESNDVMEESPSESASGKRK